MVSTHKKDDFGLIPFASGDPLQVDLRNGTEEMMLTHSTCLRFFDFKLASKNWRETPQPCYLWYKHEPVSGQNFTNQSVDFGRILSRPLCQHDSRPCLLVQDLSHHEHIRRLSLTFIISFWHSSKKYQTQWRLCAIYITLRCSTIPTLIVSLPSTAHGCCPTLGMLGCPDHVKSVSRYIEMWMLKAYPLFLGFEDEKRKL